jgi:small subunit ribosomal protein S4e
LGRKGKPLGLKRKPAPRFWPIHRKEFTWTVKPASGPHSLGKCMPLTIVLRDVLNLAKNRKEAKTIASQGRVYVDGKVRRDDDFPVGLFDVISMPDIGKSFCMLPSRKGLVLSPISSKEAEFKLCRIEGKTITEEGNVQLHFHDGSNILVVTADQQGSKENIHKVFNTLKLSVPERQILEHIIMKENNLAIITGGKNTGKYGKIVQIEKTIGKKRRNALVTIEDEKGNRHQTIMSFVFVLGETQFPVPLAGAA